MLRINGNLIVRGANLEKDHEKAPCVYRCSRLGINLTGNALAVDWRSHAARNDMWGYSP